MLHVTTEIGKPGKQEREKRHFPYLQNQPTSPTYKPRGRRYLPHGYGMYDEWKPHPQGIQPEYTENGPDWKSRLKYIPHPESNKYPAMEIFENNWKAMRPFPCGPSRMYQVLSDTYMKTEREWLLDPGLSNRGMKCSFNGEHMATRTSQDEITHTMLFGRGRTVNWIDKRNGIGESSPGDKPYKTPEYSNKFHKLGSSLPVIDFGANSPWKKGPDTFVPLQPLPSEPREPFRVKARREEKELEKKTVRALDEWRPATPLKPERVDEKK
ncbi:spermatogenesis-associated serine-rich protein 1-like isoform X6 [Ruditapes philippinarum]|uniref:spermatogenesis-associated serine-rich protein 1-like isoform X6 n=1 Tax=Ruditapes philippinarum TaxID=129788 RepID=UPI00295C3529|nr:spermatogenesis-associated serine-rich protein 1-like isoform X6 [Ruditapes philippinarum]